MEVCILLLAAGASSRMRGGDKLLERVDGVPLVRRQVLAALATGCEVVVCLPDSTGPRFAALDGLIWIRRRIGRLGGLCGISDLPNAAC